MWPWNSSFALIKSAASTSTKNLALISTTTSTKLFRSWLSSNTASITRIGRKQYLRQYPTLLVNPDGSTVTIKYHEPRKIIKLPLDLTKFTEEERKVLLERRRPKTKVKLEDDVEDVSFDSQKYLKLIKK